MSNSPELKVIIDDPEFNPDDTEGRDVLSYSDNEEVRSMIRSIIEVLGITPSSHPKIIDLGAGDGSVGNIFCKEFGWREADITFIDRFKPLRPFLKHAQWLFWNLTVLTKLITDLGQMPDEVKEHQGEYDILVAAQFLRIDDVDKFILLAEQFLIKEEEFSDNTPPSVTRFFHNDLAVIVRDKVLK